MPQVKGSRLGLYEIVSAIGAGGMGEVYRARDTRLGRDVALKVLPEAFAADAERMGRFEREAKVLASLNHPNIATIHGMEESGNLQALVMELVEGQTLADRIAQGPIPLDEALPIAKQICEGFEYAHERGIVHRDLKPANVKITPDGAVKILDFGLAKALEGEGATASDPASSPTMSRLATQAGIIPRHAGSHFAEAGQGKSVARRGGGGGGWGGGRRRGRRGGEVCRGYPGGGGGGRAGRPGYPRGLLFPRRLWLELSARRLGCAASHSQDPSRIERHHVAPDVLVAKVSNGDVLRPDGRFEFLSRRGRGARLRRSEPHARPHGDAATLDA